MKQIKRDIDRTNDNFLNKQQNERIKEFVKFCKNFAFKYKKFLEY